jgi:hypothetical protein
VKQLSVKSTRDTRLLVVSSAEARGRDADCHRMPTTGHMNVDTLVPWVKEALTRCGTGSALRPPFAQVEPDGSLEAAAGHFFVPGSMICAGSPRRGGGQTQVPDRLSLTDSLSSGVST